MKVAHSEEGSREGHSLKPSKTASREGPGRLREPPDLGITQLPEVEPLPSVSLPPLHSWAKQAKGCGSCGGAALLELFGGPARAQGRSQIFMEWIASQFLERTPERVTPRGSPYVPLQAEKGSLCLGDLSPAPLDICQLGSSVLIDIMCSEPVWAKVALCHVREESYYRTLSPTPMCPGMPKFLRTGRVSSALLKPLPQAPNGWHTLPRPNVGQPPVPAWP